MNNVSNNILGFISELGNFKEIKGRRNYNYWQKYTYEIKNEDILGRAKAIEKDGAFSKSRLHDEFRMKPKKDAKPVKSYKNGYGGKFYIYKIVDCVPLREMKKREPTEKELLSRQISGLKAKLRSNTAMTGKEIAEWFKGYREQWNQKPT